jgi:tetrapyrrole methylase family protein/MazG family protein
VSAGPGPTARLPDGPGATARLPDGPVPSSEEGRRLLELVNVMARLRAPGGCPWDREQTHETLARHLLEESHELLDAIDRGDPDAIRDELGDLLLQVVFHAQISADAGGWDVDDVARRLVEKLVHRHPHVFGDVEVSGADEVLVNWERLKAEESGGRPAVDEAIPPTLPALARAAKVQRRAAGWGADWPSPDEVIEEVRRAADALGPDDAEERIGALLFAAVGAARALGVDAETALRRTTRDFAERFEARAADLERSAGPLSVEELRDLFRGSPDA